MSDTTTITPSKDNNDGKKNLAAKAATMAAGVAAGVVGAEIASDLNNDEDAIATPEEIQDQTEANSGAETSTAEDSSTPEPAQEQAPTSEPAIEQEPIPSDNPEPVAEEPAPAPNTTTNATPTEQPVNPDEIAEAIISEEQIDPNDIDLANVVNFDEIGTVYTVDGESHTAAAFHDNEGNQLMMVDVDGDDVFDLIYDDSGEAIAEVPGKLTVDDAQIDIADDGTYLAHNDSSNTSEFGSDTIEQDLIS
jgi:hypothetical protein